jgi:hypothetical protein
MQNSTATTIPNPIVPLITSVSMIDRGTMMEGRWISSDI